ncbi:hypothetical protein HK405_003728 [Cladochytrium tenue]|nr:hypothetical protein HK405_003728 [Cladochytrium tenue]
MATYNSYASADCSGSALVSYSSFATTSCGSGSNALTGFVVSVNGVTSAAGARVASPSTMLNANLASVDKQPTHVAPPSSDPADLLFIGADGHLVAIHKVSGVPVWSTRAPGLVYTAPTLLPHPPRGLLLVGCGRRVLALRAADGAQAWSTSLAGAGLGNVSLAMQPTGAAASDAQSAKAAGPPHMTADVVFVAANYVVRAVRLSDGADLWEFRLPTVATFWDSPALLIEDGVLYVARRGRVHAIDALKGHQLWSVDLAVKETVFDIATMRSSPLFRPSGFDPSVPSPQNRDQSKKRDVLAGVLVAGTLGTIKLLSQADGQPLPLAGAVAGAALAHTRLIPLPASGSLLVSCGVNLRRFDLHSGTLIWENRLNGMGVGSMSILVGAGLPPQSSPPPAYLPTGDDAKNAPVSGLNGDTVSTNDRVYACLDGSVHAMRASDGVTLWTHDMGFLKRIKMARLLAAEDGRLFVAGDGRIRCISADAGLELWSNDSLPKSRKICLATAVAGDGETNRSSAFDRLEV